VQNVGAFSSLRLLSINIRQITEMLIKLTEVTRDRLRDVELELLQVLWGVAQQVNPRQKVEVVIR